jgi:hypothetical protein
MGLLIMAQGPFVELAAPDDSFLDVFCCGQARVDQYFRTREWLAEKSKGGPLTQLEGQGFGDLDAWCRPSLSRPNESLGRGSVLRRFSHGRPRGTRAIQGELCCPEAIWVRSTNARAISFYTKDNFVTDPAGPFQLDDGDPMLTMRKFLR